MLSSSVFGLTLGVLIAGGGAAQAASPLLPTGGKVVSGSAVIGTPGAAGLTVTQSSAKAILDWSSFSIGKGGSVSFDNGKGATLNRVIGAQVSSLDGLLSATGSVYLINPNGVIIGKSGVVEVGGSFVSSTLDTSDASFLSGGVLRLSGSSNAAVVNYGKVGALGGDVALVAARVENDGSISAVNGDAGLLAGYRVVLTDASLDEGRFAVELGGAGTSVTNGGLIQAADAELRAEGGNVYALAGDTAGVVRATGVKGGGGKVWLVADGGTLDVAGTISAQAKGGGAGTVETSGHTVQLGSARIDAHSGTWLVDPYDLTIDATAAATLDNALNAGTSVTEQTTASGSSGAGVVNASGGGDIIVAAPITWSTSAGLILSAYRNIDINAQVTASGGGALTLVTDNSGAGDGGTLLFNGGSIQFTGVSAGQPTGSLAIGVGTGAPAAYTLVSDLQTLAGDVTATNAGFYALAETVDGSNADVGYSKSPIPSTITIPFAGRLEGLGNSVVDLTINDNTTNYVGLFGQIAQTGSVRDLQLVSGSVTGNCLCGQIPSLTLVGSLAGTNAGFVTAVASSVDVSGSYTVGGLLGTNSGTVTFSSKSGQTTGSGTIGGLVGINSGALMNVSTAGSVSTYGGDGGGVAADNTGTISNSWSSASVSSLVVPIGSLGGLVGSNGGTLSNDYATGTIQGGSYSGGLVGDSHGGGQVTQSWASGAVLGATDAGGLIGLLEGGIISYSYALGSVSSSDASGGLIGSGSGSVSNTYASGQVSGGAYAGGLAGFSNIRALNSFYDTETTGQTTDAAGATGLTTAQFSNATSPIANLGLATNAGGPGFVIIDADGTLNGSNGATRPILLSEYSTSITSAHQLQLMTLDPTAKYTLAADIDASGTAALSDIWYASGFVPVGQTYGTAFTGVLDGQSHVISGLTIDRIGTPGYTGLIGMIGQGGLVQNLSLVGGEVSGAGWTGGQAGAVGALAGINSGGTISGITSSASVNGTGEYAGGIVGWNESGVVQDSAFIGAVSGQTGVGGVTGVNNDTLTSVYAGGSVIGNGQFSVGGVVGQNEGIVQDAYSTATVSGTAEFIGGVAGQNDGTITNAYGSYTVSGDVAGALVGANGANGVINNGYWDTEGAPQSSASSCTNGQCTMSQSGYGVGSNFGTLNSVHSIDAPGYNPSDPTSYAGFDFSATGPWVDLVGRPMLRSEYSTTIVDAHQLQLVELNLAVNYRLAADIDASPTSAALGPDVWIADGFAPLGDGYVNSNGSIGPAFTGSFDGAGHTISGLAVFGVAYAGLFGDIGKTGLVANLQLSEGGVQGLEDVGGLAGENDGEIFNVSSAVTVVGTLGTDQTGHTVGGDLIGGLVGLNTGVIDSSSASGQVSGLSYVGGLVGGNEADPGLALIANSHASGAVFEIGGGFAGGLVGQSGTYAVLTPTLLNDYATGSVTGTGGDGGLVGDVNSGLVQGSYATGAVSASAATYPNLYPSSFGSASAVGGLVGYIGHVQATSLIDDYATGDVIGAAQVGGLIGGMRPPSSDYPAGVTIQASYADGDVSGTSQVGGLIGYNEATLTSSYAGGAVSGASGKVTQIGGLIGINLGQVSQVFATGDVQGGSQVGGLIGVNNATVDSSYALGAVTGSSGKVGGLVGENTGYLSNDRAQGAVTGNNEVGGLVGLNDLLVSYAVAANVPGALSNDTAVGSVTGQTQVGGLVGRNDGFVDASGASGAVTGYNQVGGLIGYNSGQGGSGVSFTVTNSYATGPVSATSGKGTPAGAGGQVGGLIGENNGLLTLDSASGAVSGLNQVGGLVGQNTILGTITASYATGPVSGSSGKGTQIGGLVGYNNGLISNAYATGSISGASGKGALVGENDTSGTISTSYAIGSGGAGFAGVNRGALFGDVFDAGATGTSVGVGTGSGAGVTAVGGSTGLDPYATASYSAFNFNDIWTITPGASRPYLQENAEAPPPT